MTIWAETLNQLKQQMPAETFHWLANSTAEEAGDRLTVHLASEQAREWVANRLARQIGRMAEHVAGRRVEIRYEANGTQAPAPRRDETPPQTPPAPDSEAQQVPADLVEFDFYGEGGGGWVRFPHYAPRFVRPYLGDEAFDIWEYIRARSKDAQISWTPPLEVYGSELAAVIRANVQRVVGVWRQCRVFNRCYLQDGEVLAECCGLHEGGEIGKIRSNKFPQGRPACRYWVHGALEILVQEGLAVLQKHGSSPRSTFYTIQVYQRLPLLVPRQVARLQAKLQVAHARFLRARGKLEAWQEIDVYSMLALAQDEAGLELPVPEVGVFRARARNSEFFRARARNTARNIIFFSKISRAAHENGTEEADECTETGEGNGCGGEAFSGSASDTAV